MIDDITLGRIAYEAYAEVESETGLIAIPWGDELADSVKSWWQTGAEAVAAHLGALECTPLPAPQPERELAAAMAETRELRELVVDMLTAFTVTGSGRSARVGQVQIAKWRKRAGLPE